MSCDTIRPIRGTHGNTESYIDQMNYAQVMASQKEIENEPSYYESLPSNPSLYQPSNNLPWQKNSSTFYEDNEKSNLLEVSVNLAGS